MTYYILPDNDREIEDDYPGWSALLKKLSAKCLKANHLKTVLGLSYRQLNDWENRGVLRTMVERPFAKKVEGWRKFAIIDLFHLGIYKLLKSKGVPISKATETLISIDLELNSFIPNIVYGYHYYYVTNLNTIALFKCLKPNDQKLIITKAYLDSSEIVIISPLDNLIDDIFCRLNLSDFRAIKNEKTNNYDFIINGVPLALEKLPKMND